MGKRYSVKMMEYPLVAKTTRGMYLYVMNKYDNAADYIRGLIMEDNNIDINGNELTSNKNEKRKK